jgi:BirA family biotin operon repressor/biotin-[acetyl-CoA-carboxylase] ligase
MGALYDGTTAEQLATALSLPRVVLFDQVTSTMDVANELGASGAAAGTLVLADAQVSGRGRAGRRWESRAGDGIWLTLLERMNDVAALDVLSLRAGIRVARALDRFAGSTIRLKWPNDLYLDSGKLGGILVETRWRGTRPDWTSIGVGINVRAVEHPDGAALGGAVSRLAVLGELIPAVRAAVAARGHLSEGERQEFARRDLALNRTCVEPVPGEVLGIAADGSLEVATPHGERVAVRGGTLRLQPREQA